MRCIAEELWNRVPAHNRAAPWAMIERHRRHIATVASNVAELTGRMQEVTERCGHEPLHVSRLPATDRAGVNRYPRRAFWGCRKEGQSLNEGHASETGSYINRQYGKI
jgi:hypothetical protein